MYFRVFSAENQMEWNGKFNINDTEEAMEELK